MTFKPLWSKNQPRAAVIFSWICFRLLFLLSAPLIALVSSDGPVVGQRDRDVGWPHGQHHSAWEEETVIAGPALPPTIWQQVQHIFQFSTLSSPPASTSLKNCIIQFMNVADKLRAARHRRYSRLLYVWPSPVTVSSSPVRKTMRLCFCRQLCVCSLSASQSVFTLVVLKLQARSGRGSQSLESNHQRVAGPDRIRPDTPLSAWQRIFNMMPASICCHGYKFEILLGARLQTCPMMHFAPACV